MWEAILKYQSGKSSMTIKEVVQRKMFKSDGSETGNLTATTIMEGEKKDFLIRQHIGLDYDTKPMISHVLVDDFDNDGLLDVIVCDALAHTNASHAVLKTDRHMYVCHVRVQIHYTHWWLGSWSRTNGVNTNGAAAGYSLQGGAVGGGCSGWG